MKESSELTWRIKSFGGKVLPALFLNDAPIDLIIPKHLQRLPLRIVVCTSQSHLG
jgi:hypothetical protein